MEPIGRPYNPQPLVKADLSFFVGIGISPPHPAPLALTSEIGLAAPLRI